MSQTQEFENLMRGGWSILTKIRKKWGAIGSAFLSLILVYPLTSMLFKFDTSVSGWVLILIIAISGKYFAYQRVKNAEEKYFGEFPALISERE